MTAQKSQIRLMQTHRSSARSATQPQIPKGIIYQTQNTKGDDQEEDLNKTLFQRFNSFLKNQKINKLNVALKKHYGRNYPIQYKSQYGFNEYWQDKKIKSEQPIILQYFQYPDWYYYPIALFILISKLFIIWSTSVHRLYQFNMNGEYYFLTWAIFTLIFDVILQYYHLNNYDYFKEANLFFYFKTFWKDILLFFLFVTQPAHYYNYDKSFLAIDIVIMILLYARVQQIKKCFKIQITATSYKNTFNIIQLFMTLLPLAHIFALSLYWVAQTNQQKNWVDVHQLQNNPPIQKYVYSLYFALTTMLTVGYGDFIPVNIREVLVIMVTQIIGIVTYGYIINQIGHIISRVRKQDQILSHDISTISKMAKYYDLDKVLVSKAKNFLVSKKIQLHHLTSQQQKTALGKLQDDLRQQINKQNSLKILKSSLFFVCNWTKRFQLQIAKKVHKKIFSPNEEIIQIPNKERVYIFKKGKVQIHANRYLGFKKNFKKILRSIEANQTLQVSDNIYGYSFFMSNSPIKLTAITKDFVVAYYIQKKDFMENVMDSHLDIQYFYQMKHKIDETSYPQSWEAPSIINSKQHYFPSIQLVIKKNNKRDSKNRNVRTQKIDLRRFRPKCRRILFKSIQQIEQYCYRNSQQSGVQVFDYMIGSVSQHRVISQNIIASQNKLNSTTKTIEYIRNNTWISSKTPTQNNNLKKQHLHYLFEQGRQYSIYFKKSNRTQVIQKLQNSNYNIKSNKYAKEGTFNFSTIRKVKSLKKVNCKIQID